MIQDEIDFDDDFPQKYRLDVSSPGLDKPLVYDFQFKRTIGKKQENLLLETGTFSGNWLILSWNWLSGVICEWWQSLLCLVSFAAGGESL